MIHCFIQAGADEIVNDIELRISELFLEKLTAGSQVITITDVEEVITKFTVNVFFIAICF